MTHFALRDFFESILALLLFAPLFIVPGYLAASTLAIAGFRQRSLLERLCWSVPFSIGLSTILTVWFASIFGLAANVVLYLAFTLAGIVLIVQAWRRHHRQIFLVFRERYARLALYALLFWCLISILQLIDLQWGQHLYVSVTVRDHCYRTAFIQSVLRSGVPPTNPLYYTGRPALMRNYYFWYVVCASVCKASGLAARNVLVASCTWAALGMFSVAALFCKYFLPPVQNVRRTALFSVLLFGATGLDLLMVMYLHFSPIHRFDADMEWWDPDHFPSWLDSFLYVPHHVASLVCCLAALLVLWVTRDEQRALLRWGAVVCAALFFTSAFGLSIYVAFAFAITVLIWAVALFFSHQRKLVGNIAVAAVTALVLLIPFLLQLRGETEVSGSKKSFPLTVQLRQLYGLNDWADSLQAHHLFWAAHAKILRTLLWCLLVLPDLTLELGLFGFCGVLVWLGWRRGHHRHHPGLTALLILTSASFFSTMAVRSSITTINDYGFRTAMLPLFLLLILTAYFLSETVLPKLKRLHAPLPAWLRVTTVALLGVGLAGTFYQAVGVRFFLTLYEQGRLRDHRTNGAFPHMSTHVYHLREAYRQLSKIAPPGAIVQYNPESIGSYFLYVNMLNVAHQVVAAEPGCGKSFGGDALQCPVIEQGLRGIYDDPASDERTVLSLCSSLGINYLVVSDQDPAWQDSSSWVWELQPVISVKDVRIFHCVAR